MTTTDEVQSKRPAFREKVVFSRALDHYSISNRNATILDRHNVGLFYIKQQKYKQHCSSKIILHAQTSNSCDKPPVSFHCSSWSETILISCIMATKKLDSRGDELFLFINSLYALRLECDVIMHKVYCLVWIELNFKHENQTVFILSVVVVVDSSSI